MAKIIEQLSLMDVAPPSITGDRKIQNLITEIAPEILNVSQDIREAFIISRIHELPEEALDLLAWQWHVDFYDIAHTLETKRAMVLKSILWHRKKGTRGAILEALSMLGVEARFTSWQDLQDEGAQPYTFVIYAKLTPDFWERVDWTKPTQTIRRAIEESKAVRSWMSRLYVYLEAQAEHDIIIGSGTFQGAHHAIDFVRGTSSNEDLNISIGTGTFQNTHHDIAIVQGTYSASGLGVNIGAGIIQGGHHDIDMVQGVSGNSGLVVSVGTGTFHTWTHEVEHVWATEAKADSSIYIGANVIQGARHEVSVRQNTLGSSSLDVSVGTGTFQNISHDVNIQQSTNGTANGEITIGADIVQGSHHDIDLNQPTSGGAKFTIPVGTGLLHKVIHEVSIEQSKNGEAYSGVHTSAGITQGSHHDIDIRQPVSGYAGINIATGTGILQAAIHKISIGMSTPARAEICTGTALAQEITHGIGIKRDSLLTDSGVSVSTCINHGGHHDIDLPQSTSSAKSAVSVGFGLCCQVTHEVGNKPHTNGKANSGLCSAIGVVNGSHHIISAGMSTLAKSAVFSGTAIMHDISHTVDIKRNEGISAGGFSTCCAMSCGIYMQIKMAA